MYFRAVISVWILLLAGSILQAVEVAWDTPQDVPINQASVDVTGQTIGLTLNFAPAYTDELTVIKNTGLPFIFGEYDNLHHGQIVGIPFDGVNYYFVANYYGGSGNDLVLRRLANWLVCWGAGGDGQLGINATQFFIASSPNVVREDAIAIRDTFLTTTTGGHHSLALKPDGTLLAWGGNGYGQLGNPTVTALSVGAPVVVDATPGLSALAGRRVVAVAAGESHTIALCSDGTVVAWGSNLYGELGTGDTTLRNLPVEVSRAPGLSALAGRTVVAITAGAAHNLALCSDGTLVAWGRNSSGQLGDGSSIDQVYPVLVSTLAGQSALEGREVSRISAGGSHSLALCSDGAVVAWGENGNGQLGNDTTVDAVQPGLVNTVVGLSALAGKVVTQISAGGAHSLALSDDGSVAAWGSNAYGQLGDATTIERHLPVAVDTAPGTSYLAGRQANRIAAGKNHSVAGCTDLTVCTWGLGSNGQLGASSSVNHSSPVALTSITYRGPPSQDGWAMTGSSSNHNLMVRLVGSLPILKVTGPAGEVMEDDGQRIDFGALTLGATTPAKTFTFRNTGSQEFLDLALTIDGNGAADYQISALSADHLAPGESTTIQVVFAPTVVGGGSARLHLTNDPTGLLSSFDIRLGGTCTGSVAAELTSSSDVPISADGFVATGSSINVQLEYAPEVGAALVLVENTGQDFVEGEFENLAQGQTVSLSYGGHRYDFVAHYFGGTGNDLVLEWKNNRLVAWGSNAAGKLGVGTALPVDYSTPTPTSVSPAGSLAGKTILSTASGSFHSLAVCSDGTVSAWGDNSSRQLGIPGGPLPSRQLTPAQVYSGGALAGKRIISCAAGFDHSLALDSDGHVYAWGRNTMGQLGIGTGSTISTTPVAVSTEAGVSALAGKTVVAIAAGRYFSAALCSDGTCALWGSDADGQLGLGSLGGGNRSVPAAMETVLGINRRRVIRFACGSSHCIALLADGTIYSWGSGDRGQRGIGYYFSSGYPSRVLLSEGVSDLFGRVVVDIAAGGDHSFALCSDGEAVGWGAYPAAGNGALADQFNPKLVDRQNSALNGRVVRQLAAGTASAAAVCSDGQIAAWGSNAGAVIGDGTTASRPLPVLVDSSSLGAGETFTKIAMTGADNVWLSVPYVGATALAVVAIPPTADISVAVGAVLLQDGGLSVSMGSEAVAVSGTPVTFTITNTGTAPLTGLAVAIEGVAVGEFSGSQPLDVSLFPGDSTTFTASFSPYNVGARLALLQVSSNAPGRRGVFDIELTGTGFVNSFGPAAIRRGPASLIVSLGGPATFDAVTAGAATITYQWTKNNRAVAGARSAIWSLPAARLSDAAIYRCTAKNTEATDTSEPAVLAVVDTEARTVIQAVGTALTLSAIAAGPDLAWQWFKDDALIVGATGKNYKVAKAATGDSGAYHCVVTSAGGSLSGGFYEVKIFDSAPILIPPIDGVMPDTMVADTYAYQVAVDPAINHLATRYSASGLPSGLKIDAVTGLISGKAITSKATPYSVVVTASNSRFSARTTLTLKVFPLPPGVLGHYAAVMQEDTFYTGLGRSLEFTTTRSGSLSGRVRDGVYTYAVRGVLESNVEDQSTVSGSIHIDRARQGESSLEISFVLEAGTDLLIDGLFFDASNVVGFDGWRIPWSRDRLAEAFTGYHTFSLSASASWNDSVPQGYGYGSFAVNRTSGALKLVGKLSDGTSWICSTWVGPSGQIAVSSQFYSGRRGGIVGRFNLAPSAPTDVLSLDGGIFWTRPANFRSRAYPDGFLAEHLEVFGGRYIAPSGSEIVLDLDPEQIGNAALSFVNASGSYVGPLPVPSIALSIGVRNRITLPPAAQNPRKTRLTISPSKGTLSGSFTMVDPNPLSPTRRITRVARFYGLISRDDDSVLRGHGWFLLPELPAFEGETSANTEIRSGSFVLDAAVP